MATRRFRPSGRRGRYPVDWENLCLDCHEDEHSRGLLGDYLTGKNDCNETGGLRCLPSAQGGSLMTSQYSFNSRIERENSSNSTGLRT